MTQTTLHAETVAILGEGGNRWMTTTELATGVNRRGRYRRGDGRPVTPFQVHGRTRQYASTFERDGERVRLVDNMSVVIGTDVTELDHDIASALEYGPQYRFADWPVRQVPDAAAGVYTIWAGDEFVYVGMAGRGAAPDDIAVARDSGRRLGLWSRLASHASGRRSGDQFCVYVADRLVLPRLSAAEVDAIAHGMLRFDTKVKDYIRSTLAFRFVETPDGRSAFEVERAVQRGALDAGLPLLNGVPGAP